MKNNSLIIKAENLKKDYYSDSLVTSVLEGVNFSIKKGEFVSIVGVSGSGKSTLLNIMGLLDKPTSGSYFLDGRNVAQIDKDEQAYLRNQKIGFVFQRFNLLPKTSVLDNVLLPTVYNYQMSGEEAQEKAIKLLEKMGLSHRLKNYPNQISGGESQRVAIARALINSPSLILADEPTGNLGYKHTEPVMDILEELNNEGHTIILVTHSKEISAYANRQLNLVKGVIELS